MATQPQAQPSRQDPALVDTSHYTVEYEDEKVRVLRIHYGPYEKSVMHAHPPSIAVMLTDAQMRFTYADGAVENMDGKAGQVMNMPAHEHLPENLSSRPFAAILIEVKG